MSYVEFHAGLLRLLHPERLLRLLRSVRLDIIDFLTIWAIAIRERKTAVPMIAISPATSINIITTIVICAASAIIVNAVIVITVR